jgi:hypothetical protein
MTSRSGRGRAQHGRSPFGRIVPFERARSIAVVALVIAGVAVAGACGDGRSAGAKAVGDAQHGLATVHSGDLHLRMTAAAGVDSSGHDVGFELAGPFEMRSPAGGVPIARLDYAQLAGAERRTSTFVSTGTRAFVEVAGHAYELPQQQVASLAATTPAKGSLAELDLTRWAVKPRVAGTTDLDGTTVDRIDAAVDVVPALNDVLQLAGALGAPAPGSDASTPGLIAGADADRLRSAVSSSTFELLSGHDDHVLRSLRFDVTFAADQLAQVKATMGALTGAKLSFLLTVDHPNEEVHVDAPASPRPLSELASRH